MGSLSVWDAIADPRSTGGRDLRIGSIADQPKSGPSQIEGLPRLARKEYSPHLLSLTSNPENFQSLA